jgi:serine phosphatase RsbU (regulator of sigma subunit)
MQLTLQEQKLKILNSLMYWLGSDEPRDDITVIGIKL